MRIIDREVPWKDAALVVELPDMRGIQGRAHLRWGSRDVPFVAGKRGRVCRPSGSRSTAGAGLYRSDSERDPLLASPQPLGT